MAGKSYIQNVPTEYMDVKTLWNERRDPHANPLSQEPRRSIPRMSGEGMTGLLKFLYHPEATSRPGAG